LYGRLANFDTGDIVFLHSTFLFYLYDFPSGSNYFVRVTIFVHGSSSVPNSVGVISRGFRFLFHVKKTYISHYSSFQVDDIDAVRSVLMTALSRQEVGNAAREQETSCGGNVGNCHQRKIKYDLHSAGSLCMKYSENGETCEARITKAYA
jgi:hypothetical protein